MRGSDIVDGATIAIGNPVTGDILDTDALRVTHVNAGEGFEFDSTASGNPVMQGTLHIEQKGGGGQPIRGYLTATWSSTGAVHGGITGQGSEDLGPGAVSVAFDVTQH